MISIVDDDALVREALRRLFESAGFTARGYSSAEEFLDSGQLDDSVCLILDLRMPGMSGLELQTRLAASNPRLPIIFLTANGSEPARDQALKAGAIDFLSKPVCEESLITNVKAAVGAGKNNLPD